MKKSGWSWILDFGVGVFIMYWAGLWGKGVGFDVIRAVDVSIGG